MKTTPLKRQLDTVTLTVMNTVMNLKAQITSHAVLCAKRMNLKCFWMHFHDFYIKYKHWFQTNQTRFKIKDQNKWQIDKKKENVLVIKPLLPVFFFDKTTRTDIAKISDVVPLVNEVNNAILNWYRIRYLIYVHINYGEGCRKKFLSTAHTHWIQRITLI